MNYVIIGAGIAGVEAALEIRRRDADGSITIFDMDNEAEGNGCIYRPALKEFLSGAVSKEDLSIYSEGFLNGKGVTFIHDLVSSIDPIARTIEYLNTDDSGIPALLPYDRLLIATGAVPRTPSQFHHDPHPKNLFFFKSLFDAAFLRWWLGKHPGTCCVVGTGILGMETAELLTIMGREVIMLTRSGTRLFKGIPVALEKRLIDLYELKGVRTVSLDDFDDVTLEGDRYSTLTMKDGDTIPIDTVILCAGVEPSPLLNESGSFEFTRGIHVDDHMRTNVPHIFAAGDCAFMSWAETVSAPETLRLWEPARRMGRTAGANMAGGDVTFDPWPMYYHTHLFGRPLGFFGSFDAPEEGHERIVRETEDGYRELVLKDGRLVGASFLGGRPFPPLLLRLMRSGRTDGFDPKCLLDHSFDQESLWYL